jgi:hypothetical protein
MKKEDVRPIPNAGFFTAFVHEHGIDCLVRSADWYKLPPIQRYLYNMAALAIRMEDAKTETRVYSFERFDALRLLIQRSAAQEWEVVDEACTMWHKHDMAFGVVHIDQASNTLNKLLLGDDPHDWIYWEPPGEPGLSREFKGPPHMEAVEGDW